MATPDWNVFLAMVLGALEHFPASGWSYHLAICRTDGHHDVCLASHGTSVCALPVVVVQEVMVEQIKVSLVVHACISEGSGRCYQCSAIHSMRTKLFSVRPWICLCTDEDTLTVLKVYSPYIDGVNAEVHEQCHVDI